MIFNKQGSRKPLFFLAAALAFAPLASFASSLCAPPTASAYYTRTVDEERLSGQRMIMEHREENTVERSEPGSVERLVQREIVEANPGKLNFDDGKHERWLEPLYQEYAGKEGNAWSNGSVTIITSWELAMCNERRIDHDDPDDSGYSVYRNQFYRNANNGNVSARSNLASVLAHECAHFVNKDGMRYNLTNEENRKSEQAADIEGMNLLVRTPAYSPGTMASFHIMEMFYGYYGGGRYPSVPDMIKADAAYLKEMSGGRVELEVEGADSPFHTVFRLKVDGKLFAGTGVVPSHGQEGTSVERTSYLAGQIAAAMKMGIWKPSNIYIMPLNEYMPTQSAKKSVVIVTENGSKKIKKVLGVFDFPKDVPDDELSDSQKKEKEVCYKISDIL